MRTAIRLYETGAAKTKKEASTLAGLDPSTFTVNTYRVPGQVQPEQDRVRAMLDEKAVDMSVLLNALGMKAIERIHDLMEGSPDHKIQLRAAIDLADRAPQTSKVQRHQVTALTLDGKDAAAIAEALVAAARVREEYSISATGDFVRAAQPEDIKPVAP